jgi:hypothetical protein
MLGLAIIVVMCLVFLLFSAAAPIPPNSEREVVGGAIQKWEEGDATCFILIDTITKKPITMSCVLNK